MLASKADIGCQDLKATAFFVEPGLELEGRVDRRGRLKGASKVDLHLTDCELVVQARERGYSESPDALTPITKGRDTPSELT